MGWDSPKTKHQGTRYHPTAGVPACPHRTNHHQSPPRCARASKKPPPQEGQHLTTPLPTATKDTRAGAIPSRGERCRRMVSSRAAGPDFFPSCSIALVPQPDPTKHPGRSWAPSPSASPASAAHAPAAVHAQRGCRKGAKAWQGLRVGGPAGGWEGRGEARSVLFFALLFLCFSLPLPAVAEPRGFNQPWAESGAWHARSQSTDGAGRKILFI